MQKITVIKELNQPSTTAGRRVRIRLEWGGETAGTLYDRLCDDCGLGLVSWSEPWHDLYGCLGCGVKDRRYIGE